MVKFILLACVTIGCIYGILWELRRRKLKRRRFSERTDLNMADIVQIYFSQQDLCEQKVIKNWQLVADILHLDPGKLRPEDRCTHELSPVEGCEVDDEFEDLAEHYLGLAEDENISDFKWPDTLGDLIRIFSRK